MKNGRIVIRNGVCGGRPFFDGTRIPVYIVLEMLANHETESHIFEAYPDLTKDDLSSAMAYARDLAALPMPSLQPA